MDAIEKGFNAPVVEFFSPKKRTGYGIGLIKQVDNGLVMVYGHKNKAYSQFCPRELITALSPNEFGGISLHFSFSVKYNGNFGGGHELDVSPYFLHETDVGGDAIQRPHFDYNHIVRVRKPSGEVVWENIDVPKRKKLLKEEPAKQNI